MAHDRLWNHRLEIGRSGVIPLLDGAAEGAVRNAANVQSLKHHGGLPSTPDCIVLKVNTRKKVLQEGRVEPSLPQTVGEGMADPDKVKLRARIPGVSNQLGAHEALNHMPGMT